MPPIHIDLLRQVSADDPRPSHQGARVPDRIQEKDLSREKSVVWIGMTVGLLLTSGSLAFAQSGPQPAQDGDENNKLKRIVADLSLDKEMLQDVIRRKL
jgi:hypothetical protein